MSDRSQVDVPDAVSELVEHLAPNLYGQSRLTRTAVAGQRDQAVLCQQLTHVRHFGLAADKTRKLRRKPLQCRRFRDPKWRELVAKIGMTELRHSFPARDIAQLMRAQVRQPRSFRKLFEHQCLGDSGQDSLSPVREVAKSRGPIDGGADVIT